MQIFTTKQAEGQCFDNFVTGLQFLNKDSQFWEL